MSMRTLPGTEDRSTEIPQELGAEDYREALSRFPSGVTIVVTEDPTGAPRGFTASAFTAVSQDPPLVLVCLTKSADSYPAFTAAEKFAIHFAADGNTSVAIRFATKGADKFAGGDFDEHPDGLPALRGAIARLSCSMHARYDGGDHDILVGRVEGVHLGKAETPAVYHARRFHTLVPLGG
ncbi:flavin reductase family protein [Rhodococcus aetherivorans]|uniref:flavin reductase family protein n=1 Tax=Rhodococcus aetherivorans TaxID=191292 RepID=UPI000AB821A7|nr:flavin reductase family protein [Rhodococcus aetherivorans]